MKDWCLAHPWMTFWILIIFISGVQPLISRFFRMVMIVTRGWPTNPTHDADGDFKEDESIPN